jgi:hypothetical protein
MFESKIVVFDLDETLGYFTQLFIIWESINTYLKNNCIDRITLLSQSHFNELCNIFPEYIRPNIENVLYYLLEKKDSRECKQIMIYTNNKRDKEWVFFIKKYFEMKIRRPIFDQIIRAFKINGQPIEILRSSHHKTHDDFIKCAKIPADTQICFIDNTYYPNMHTDEVYYIKIKSYKYSLSIDTIIRRLSQINFLDDILKIHKTACIKYINSIFINNTKRIHFPKSLKEYEVDKIVTKEILNQLDIFFYKGVVLNIPKNHHKTRTKKTSNNKTSNNKTKKRLE